jgi:hypothetical protein
MRNENNPSPIFTPSNEPYLGEYPLYVFDELIVATMKNNRSTAIKNDPDNNSPHQNMAALLIPQSISIALSIRELIRQGYLFGASVLLRSFIERTAIMFYIYHFPDEINLWENGWLYRQAPSLSQMFDKIQKKNPERELVEGWKLTKELNSLVHGKPDSINFSIIKMDGFHGISSGKIIDRPDLCNYISDQMISWLSIINAMMNHYFPEK